MARKNSVVHFADSLRQPLWRRLLPLVWGFAAVVVLVLALAGAAFQVQLTLAGFLNAESLWSKAQKQAVIDLDAYAARGNAADLAAFRHELAVIEVDRWAREAIIAGQADDDRVRAALARSSMVPDAVSGMSFTLRHLSQAPYISAAIEMWRSTDPMINEFKDMSTTLQRAYAVGQPTTAFIAAQRARIAQLNRDIAPRSSRFAYEVVNGAVLLARLLFVAVLLGLLGVAALWLGMARRVLHRIRGSEARYRLLFDSAAVAIAMVDEASGSILETNQLMAAWVGRPPEELPGTPFDALLQPESSQCVGPSLLATLVASDGGQRPVEMQVSHAVWGYRRVRQIIMRDISERLALEHERRVAAEALAGIAEGVVIADAEHRVVSVNAAHGEITGFASADVRGHTLDELHRLPDGAALPEAAWPGGFGPQHWSGQVVGRRADGSTYPAQLSISAIRSAQHEVLHYVAVFSDIRDEQTRRQRLEHLAMHDPLTGLYNRAEFERRCEEALTAAARNGGAVAVLFVDLDAFKMVNDSYSHAVGDRLLQRVAERIGRELGKGDLAGRIGGDEFTVLLDHLALREDAGMVAQRLLASLAEPVMVDDCELTLSASIGIAGYPLDGGDVPTLIANADAAMYVAKNAERNTFRYYTPVMQAHARQRLLLVSQLRRALAEGEFHLVFQPSVDLRSGRVVAVEALLRWQHPERGELPPTEFIPAAESLGLIRYIDEWVLNAACRQICVWQEADVPAIRVAVNLSGRAFGHPGFIANLKQVLQQYAIEPGRLALEITEGTMLRMGDETERTMKALHALGVEVAIDDFGTGYASMAYLKLPSVTTLKIDRSFVTGLPQEDNDVAIAQTILAMAHSLGLRTIAEGIETEEQHEFLCRAGCDEGQGYLYARPQPAAAIECLLAPQVRRGTPHLRLVPHKRA